MIDYKRLPEFRVRQITRGGRWFVQRKVNRAWKPVSNHDTEEHAESRARSELRVAMRMRHDQSGDI